MIEIKDSLILSDNCEYVVASKASYNNNVYLYLIDIQNNTNFKFVRLDDNKVIEVSDDKLCARLLPLFLKESKSILEEINE